MSKYEPVEEIPERGNVTIIDGASWRALISEGDKIPKDCIWRVHLAQVIWQYMNKDKEQIAEELELDDMLRKDFCGAVERQERFNKSAHERQQVSRYRGFKTNLERKGAKYNVRIKAPPLEKWVAIGAPGVEEYMERVLNGEFGDTEGDKVRQVREAQEEAGEW
jgi:hypothetical protein